MKPSVLLSTIPSDSHSWNLIFLQLFLTERGFDVVSLGPCTPIALIIETAAKRKFDLHLVSTVNGHGIIEAPAIAAALFDAGNMAPIAIGGKLDTGTNGGSKQALERAGFAGVFEDDQANVFAEFETFLKLLAKPCSGMCKTCKSRKSNGSPSPVLNGSNGLRTAPRMMSL